MPLKKEAPLLPKQGMLVLVITLVAASVETMDRTSIKETKATPNNTIKLVEKIRRQLMANNSDYLQSTSEDDSMPAVQAAVDGRKDYRKHDDTATIRHASDDDLMPQTPDTSHLGGDKVRPNRGVIISRKDLLYYIDDKRLRRMNFVSDNDVNDTTSEESEEDFDDIPDTVTPDVKYKMLKVKEDKPTRRRKAPYRRFIQEKNRDGVAIIRLDGGPFPAFQLPRARRQYMGGSGDDDDEVLPADDSS